MDVSHFGSSHDLVIVWVTNSLIDHLMVSQDHVLLGHVMFKRQGDHVINQVT
jgi:hypothetical protein